MLIQIGRPVSRDPEVVSKYVLGKFSKQELDDLHSVGFPEAKKKLDLWLKNDPAANPPQAARKQIK